MEAFIYDAVRTPRGRGKASGKLHGSRPVVLAATVLAALRERNQLDTALVEDVLLGCVTPIGEQGADIAKLATQYAGYSHLTAGATINRFCSSGLEAVNTAAAYVMSGMAELIIAGGVESMSRVPMGSDGGSWMIDPDVMARTSFVPQGISADLLATLHGITRKDADAFAVESQKRAGKAWQEKRFAKSIIPVRDAHGDVVLDIDEHMRPSTTLEDLAQLKPSFLELGGYGFDTVAIRKYPAVEAIQHIHHAGNSSGIVDGAAALLIGNREIGKKLGLKPRARIRSFAVTSTEPTVMLTGPAPATRKALKQGKLAIGDIDLLEINEAFASVVILAERELGVSHEKVNVNGGSIALGHPLGATGAIILGTVLDELERTNKTLGLATLCVGGGMGVTTIIERV